MSRFDLFDGREILSAQAARDAIAPYRKKLAGAVRRAFARWEEFGRKAAGVRAPLLAAQRAAFIHRHIVSEVKRALRGEDGVVMREERGLFAVYIGEELAVRFKKLDSRARSSNIMTQQQLLISLQERLPGMKETWIIVGYQLDDAATAIRDILAVCPVRNRNAWSFSLVRSEADQTPVTATLIPIDPAEPRTKVTPNPLRRRRRSEKA